VWTICAESDEEARRLAASGRMAFQMLRRGELIAVPAPEKALAFIEAEERAREQGSARQSPAGSSSGTGTASAGSPGAPPRAQRRTVVGSPEVVHSQLLDVAAEYGADEVIAVNIVYDHQARRRSYELLAAAFGL